MEYNSPKPTKKKVSIQDRILKHPFTSLTGLILVVVSMYALSKGVDVTYCTLIGVSGLGMLGLKDPRK